MSIGMEDYLREVEAVREHRRRSEADARVRVGAVDEEEESFLDSPETRQMFDLLVQIGYGDIVEEMKQGKQVKKEDLRLATQHLDARHRHAVRRRMKTLHMTFRQRRRHNKVDVRNVFSRSAPGVPSSSSSSDSLPRPRGRHRSGDLEGEALSRQSSEDSLDGLDDDEEPDEVDNRPWKTVIACDPSAPQVSDQQPARKDPVRSDVKPSVTELLLPKFVLRLDEEGRTRMDDLSPEGVEHVRCLALMELTALLDSHGIFYENRKHKKKLSREAGVFEVPLTVLLENDRKSDPDVRVPIFYAKIIRELKKRGLNEEGLLRVPGSVTRMKAIRQAVEESSTAVDVSAADPNDLAGLLKQFLRELPVPLLTWTYLDAFYQVLSLDKIEDKVVALNYLILLLPQVHRDVLRALLDFLQAVVDHGNTNKMTLSSVAMIIAPNLFLAPSKPSKRNNGGVSSPGSSSSSETQKRQLTLENASKVSTVVQMLVTYRDILWSVPGFIVTQIRRENDDELTRKIRGDKPIIKFLGKKHTPVTREQSKPPNDPVQLDGFIRVQAPYLTKSAARVKITPELTPADVVRLFTARKDGPLGDRSTEEVALARHSLPPCVDATTGCINAFDRLSFASASSRLYEVGGNLTGERCLDPGVRLQHIYRRNPKAVWRIKPGPKYDLV